MLSATCRLSAKAKSPSSKAIIAAEKKFSASNYSPIPVVFKSAKGVMITDPEGKKFMDFLSGYGAVSQGHVHPRLIKAVTTQLQKCTLSSRAFYNDQFPAYAEYITKLFGYEKVLPMNTGAEGVETALKLARRWGYQVKGIKKDQAIIVCCSENFHGRTFGAIAMSSDPSSYEDFGPKLPGIMRVEYGNAKELKALFESHGPNIAGFICEPVQGEAGVIIPPKGYLQTVRSLCTKHNIMYIDDEVQAGVGRTGKMLAVEHEGVRPDAVILAKALGGGVMPVAAVLADAKFMDVFSPGTHGSTFGGGPVASALAMEALKVMKDEKLVQNSAKMGNVLAKELEKLAKKHDFIQATRCRGLFAAIEMKHDFYGGNSATRLMTVLKEMGVLTKVTHGHTLRLSPPLVITKQQVLTACAAFDKALTQIKAEADGKPVVAAKVATKKAKVATKKAQAGGKKVSKK